MPISINSSWEEILPKAKERIPERIANWRVWLALCQIQDSEQAESWDNAEECDGCIHYRPADYWCNSQGLPASFSPILTPKGYQGMACMGMGRQDFKEPKTEQEAMSI
jgi:hypothetical protein